MDDRNPKAEGIHTGYYQTIADTIGGVKRQPVCPYPLYEENVKPKQRNKDRDAWLEGYSLGLKLANRHQAELDELERT